MNIVEIICTVIGAIAVILSGVWAIFNKIFNAGKTAQRINSIEENVSDIKQSIENFPCSSHYEDITKIKTILVEKYPKAFSIFSMKCSPRRLNELGEKLYAKIHGDDFINKNKSVLFEFIKQTNPLVALDVEQAANAACFSLTSTPAFNDLKDFVYNEPTWELGDGSKYDITLNDLCFVIGLKLRDRYLDEVGLGVN